MATDPQTLFSEAKCYLCFEITADEALELALLARIAGTAAVPLVPSAPTNLLISPATTNGNIILNWTAAGSGPAPTSYQIWLSINGGAYAQVGSVGGGVTTFTDTTVLAANDQDYYKVRAVNGSGNSAFTDPAGIFESFNRVVNTGTVTYSFPFLQMVLGTFIVGNEASLTTISVPKLHTVTADFVLIDLAVFTTLIVTNLATVGGGCGVFDSPSILTTSWPALVTVGNYFGIARNAGITTTTIPLLASVGADLQFYQTPALTALSCPSLTTVGTDLNGGVSGLSSFSAPLLVSLGAQITIDLCPNLTVVTIPNVIFQDGGNTITLDSDILNAASVNQVLARGVASATTSNDYELNSPGNAAPTGQGILDAAALIIAGNTVNTN